MPHVQARSVSKAFGPTVALSDVGFEVERGEVHALVGENGSGKSTLMRLLHGEEHPDSGTLMLDGQSFSPSSPREALDRGVALIHQELAVCPHLTIAENIFLGAEMHRLGRLNQTGMVEESRQLLAQLGHGELNPNRLVIHLSPARRQIVEIARALRSNAQVLLFDEPTSSLGRQDVAALFAVIRDLKSQGRAIVYISHFLDEISEIADRATVLRDGRVVGTLSRDEFSLATLAEMMVGRELHAASYQRNEPTNEVAVKAEGLTGRRLPKDVNLEIRKGEVFGFAGLNGAGRTETLRCLFGLDTATHGTVTLADNPIKPDARRSWRRKVGMVSEDRKSEGLAVNLSITENLTLPNPGKRLINHRIQAQRTHAVITRLRVKCASGSQTISQLSGGNQQKVAIGRLLDSDSHVLLLDEPTRGIDIGSKAEIYHLISDLAAAGRTILIASSYLPELTDLCDRIAIFRRGEIVAVVDARTSTQNEIMEWCAGA